MRGDGLVGAWWGVPRLVCPRVARTLGWRVEYLSALSRGVATSEGCKPSATRAEWLRHSASGGRRVLCGGGLVEWLRHSLRCLRDGVEWSNVYLPVEEQRGEQSLDNSEVGLVPEKPLYGSVEPYVLVGVYHSSVGFLVSPFVRSWLRLPNRGADMARQILIRDACRHGAAVLLVRAAHLYSLALAACVGYRNGAGVDGEVAVYLHSHAVVRVVGIGFRSAS